MENEENILESNMSKKSINFWKILFILLVSVAFISFLSVSVYNSDWFVNTTLHIKKAEDIQLGKHITYSYKNKYEANNLKINMIIKHIDEKVMNFAEQHLDEDDCLISLIFLDKDGFKLAELKINKKDFINDTSEKGQYGVRTSLLIDKKTIRKVTRIDASYREFLDMTHSELFEEARKRMDYYYYD